MTALDNRLFIFDCDGVLVDSELLIARIEAQEVSAVGYPLSPEEDIRLFSGKSLRFMLETIEASLGKKLPDDFCERLERRLKETLSAELSPCHNIHEILQRARHKCVASSGLPPMIQNSLHTTGLDSFFKPEAVFSASMVERGNPHPDLFLFAAQKMGYAPQNCIVIEDSIAGIEAARAANIPVLGYVGASHVIDPDHANKLKQLGARAVFSTFLDMVQAFDGGFLE